MRIPRPSHHSHGRIRLNENIVDCPDGAVTRRARQMSSKLCEPARRVTNHGPDVFLLVKTPLWLICRSRRAASLVPHLHLEGGRSNFTEELVNHFFSPIPETRTH